MLASISVGALAFSSPLVPASGRGAVTMSMADGMCVGGAAHETGNTVWDPLGIADLGSVRATPTHPAAPVWALAGASAAGTSALSSSQ
eukprot:gene6760-5803_t